MAGLSRVPKSKTRQPASIFQPFLRWAKGGRRDTTSLLSKLASTLDDWLELGDKRPSPIRSTPGTSEFAKWLAEKRGYTNIAKGRRERFGSAGPHDKIYSESEYEIIPPSDYDEPAWLTPPEFLAELDREFNFTKGFDPCPYPRPAGFDGLTVEWPQSTYCNPPFRKKDGKDGHGIAAFARKAIAENKLGKSVVLVLPTKSTINFMLEAGAELGSARRINWIDPKTGQPATTSPSSNMLAILRGKEQPAISETAKLKARVAELEAENATLKARIMEFTKPDPRCRAVPRIDRQRSMRAEELTAARLR